MLVSCSCHSLLWVAREAKVGTALFHTVFPGTRLLLSCGSILLQVLGVGSSQLVVGEEDEDQGREHLRHEHHLCSHSIGQNSEATPNYNRPASI